MAGAIREIQIFDYATHDMTDVYNYMFSEKNSRCVNLKLDHLKLFQSSSSQIAYILCRAPNLGIDLLGQIKYKVST